MNKISELFHSLRVRVFIIIILIGLLPGVIGPFLLYHQIRNRSVSSDVTAMSSQASLLADEIIANDYLNNTRQDLLNMKLNAVGNVYSGRVMIINDRLVVVKDTYDMYEGRTMVWKNVILSSYGESTSDYDEQNHTLTITIPIINPNSGEIQGIVLITNSAEFMEANLAFYHSFLVMYELILLGVMIFVAFFTSLVIIGPMKHVKKGIDDLSRGFGDGTLNVSDVTESVEISKAFNDFNAGMKLLDESRQEFVSNVSHELKTPLASMKVLADSINSMGENAPVDLYREFMEDITNEIDRETKIVNDLLALVKMDKTDAQMNVAPVNVNELIELIMRRLKPIAEKQEVELVLESFRPVTVEMDEVKFSLAISNLIENGIKYNEPGGYVHVSLNADHQYCYINVEDSGMGIPEDSLDHIFERFYRVDKSHSREIGGTGLGLAITQNAIQMHRGEIKVSSVLGEGTTFSLRIPLSYIPNA